MKNYVVTKWYDKWNDTCLEYTCGANRARAEEVKARCEQEDPEGKYFIEEVEEKDQWWNQGWLD